jgi:hypothetical protein
MQGGDVGGDGLATQRVAMRETADLLGVSKEAIRKRVVRGTLRSELGEDGRRHVYIEAGRDVAAAEAPGLLGRGTVKAAPAEAMEVESGQ